MSQGQFTKEETDEVCKTVQDLFDAIADSKKLLYVAHLNDILMYLEAAKRVAPTEDEHIPE